MVQLFQLIDNAISEFLIVNQHSILDGRVFPYDGFQLTIFQFVFILDLEDVIEFSNCDETIMLFVDFLDSPDDFH